MLTELAENFEFELSEGQKREGLHRGKMEFTPEGMKGKVRLTISSEYILNVTDFIVLELPENCNSCPAGICCNGEITCGRNVPWTDADAKKRPDTCKLRTLEEVIWSLSGLD